MFKTVSMVDSITSTRPSDALSPSTTARLLTDSTQSKVFMCDEPNMHFEAIDIPGHRSLRHSSAQVNADLYLISCDKLAVKKVENLLNRFHKVSVKELASLGKERRRHSSVNFKN